MDNPQPPPSNAHKIAPLLTDYLQSQVSSRWDGVIRAQTHIVNWIFTLQGAGIAGSLSFVSNHKTHAAQAALAWFIVGLVLIMLFGGQYFLREARGHGKYLKRAVKLAKNEMGPNEYIAAEATVTRWYWECITLALLSAASAAMGIWDLYLAATT
jgi:hypothetical protein